jgi:hypothetical protein
VKLRKLIYAEVKNTWSSAFIPIHYIGLHSVEDNLTLIVYGRNFTREITPQGRDKLVDLVNVGLKKKHIYNLAEKDSL